MCGIRDVGQPDAEYVVGIRNSIRREREFGSAHLESIWFLLSSGPPASRMDDLPSFLREQLSWLVTNIFLLKQQLQYTTGACRLAPSLVSATSEYKEAHRRQQLNIIEVLNECYRLSQLPPPTPPTPDFTPIGTALGLPRADRPLTCRKIVEYIQDLKASLDRTQLASPNLTVAVDHTKTERDSLVEAMMWIHSLSTPSSTSPEQEPAPEPELR